MKINRTATSEISSKPASNYAFLKSHGVGNNMVSSFQWCHGGMSGICVRAQLTVKWREFLTLLAASFNHEFCAPSIVRIFRKVPELLKIIVNISFTLLTFIWVGSGAQLAGWTRCMWSISCKPNIQQILVIHRLQDNSWYMQCSNKWLWLQEQ